MIYSDNTFDITNNIATYARRDFKSVFDTTSNKWYMLNNLNNYEEYGLYGDSFDTYYQGKLVVVNDHEYEWDGAEWDDLGPYVEQVVAVYRDSSHTGVIKFNENTSQVASIEATFKMMGSSSGDSFLIGSGADDNNDWRVFLNGTTGNSFYYDCGSGRYNGSMNGIYNTIRHMRFDGAPMRIYDYDNEQYMYTGSTIRPSSTTNIITFGGQNNKTIGRPNYGYLYDIVLYSDNDGQNAIAHYIPYIQNDTVGMYDTINDVFVPAIGTVGAENGSVRPKDYPAKSVPTISTLWASTIYRNSAHLTTLMRNDVEMAKIDYMSDDILKKGEAPAPYNIKAYLSLSSGGSYSLSPKFTTSVYLKNTYTIEFKLKTPASINGWRLILGTYETTYGANEFAIYTNNNGQYFCMNWWNYGSSRLNNDSAFTMIGNTEYVFEIQVGTGVTKINGVTLSASGGNNVAATLSKPLEICGIYSGDAGWTGLLYYIKVTEGDNLIAYYQADNSDNIPGYLDKVSNTKITNIGGGTVTYGEDA